MPFACSLPAYMKSSKKIFGKNTNHVRHIHLAGKRDRDNHNNKMERLNGEIRDREKVFRGLGTKYTANFHGMRVHYNHTRKNDVASSTQGEVAGIHVEGSNKWKTMIHNGSLFLLETSEGLIFF